MPDGRLDSGLFFWFPSVLKGKPTGRYTCDGVGKQNRMGSHLGRGREQQTKGKKRSSSSSTGKPQYIPDTKEETTLEPKLELGMNKTDGVARKKMISKAMSHTSRPPITPKQHKNQARNQIYVSKGFHGRQRGIKRPDIDGESNKKGLVSFWQRRVTHRLQRSVYIALASTRVTTFLV